ncbi:CIA30 family protein [uncultured Porticoccus sp.]|uniref:CIA30 family protein n=1 Tax=uncultured Porticoccus sp. TaxID=1256050 RepID=UPI0026267E77|nr:CIA30 family protein [uncultured Porticoccus sp.]
MTNPVIFDSLESVLPSDGNPCRWRLVTDGVMGGLSEGTLTRESICNRLALRMSGRVSLENNGGFLQMALDLSGDQSAVDAGAWQGIELDVCGPAEEYAVHLRTTELSRPWQSYRQPFEVKPEWQTVRLPFNDFVAHRTETPLNLGKLKRIGLVAIGRAFEADLALSGLRFY